MLTGAIWPSDENKKDSECHQRYAYGQAHGSSPLVIAVVRWRAYDLNVGATRAAPIGCDRTVVMDNPIERFHFAACANHTQFLRR